MANEKTKNIKPIGYGLKSGVSNPFTKPVNQQRAVSPAGGTSYGTGVRNPTGKPKSNPVGNKNIGKPPKKLG